MTKICPMIFHIDKHYKNCLIGLSPFFLSFFILICFPLSITFISLWTATEQFPVVSPSLTIELPKPLPCSAGSKDFPLNRTLLPGKPLFFKNSDCSSFHHVRIYLKFFSSCYFLPLGFLWFSRRESWVWANSVFNHYKEF